MATDAPAEPRPTLFQRGLGFAVPVAGATALWLAIWLALAVLVPTLFMGWQPFVVSTGSMKPVIQPGDVVLVDPDDTTAAVNDIVLFSDPSREGTLVLHRVAEAEDGELTTKGDANNSPDSTPVTSDAQQGRMRLLVPLAGQPLRIAANGGGPWLVAGIVAAGYVLLRLRRRSDEERAEQERSDGPAGALLDPSIATTQAVRPAFAVTGVFLLLSHLAGTGVLAAFAAPTAESTSYASAAAFPTYEEEMAAQAPVAWYRLDEQVIPGSADTTVVDDTFADTDDWGTQSTKPSLVGTPAFTSPNSAAFDAGDMLARRISPKLGDQWALTARQRPTGDGGGVYYAVEADPATGRDALGALVEGDRIEIWRSDDGDLTRLAATTFAAAPNQWLHVSLVRDGSDLTLTLDDESGTRLATQTVADRSHQIATGLTIGGFSGTTHVDDVRLTSRSVLGEDAEDGAGAFTDWGGGEVVATTDPVRNGVTALRKQANNDPNGGARPLDRSIGNDWTVRGWLRRPSGFSGGGQDRFGIEDANGNGYGIQVNQGGDWFGIERRTSGGGSQLVRVNGVSFSLDTWYEVELVRAGNGLTATVRDGSGTVIGSASTTDGSYGSFDRFAVRGGHEYFLDDISVIDDDPGAPMQPTVAVDSGPNGNDATYGGTPSVGLAGLAAGTAVDFDGADDEVAIPNATYINDGDQDQRSVSLWFNAADVQTTQVLYEQGGNSNGLSVALRNGNVELLAWSDSQGWSDELLVTAPVQAGQPHHVVLSLDAVGDELRGHLDGELVGTATKTDGQPLSSHTGAVAIGAHRGDTRLSTGNQSGDGLHADATIDEVALFDRALTGQDARYLHAAGLR